MCLYSEACEIIHTCGSTPKGSVSNPHSNAHQFTSLTPGAMHFCALFFNFASASVSQDHGFEPFLVCPFPFINHCALNYLIILMIGHH